MKRGLGIDPPGVQRSNVGYGGGHRQGLHLGVGVAGIQGGIDLAADAVDMLTLVLVGSSRTRAVDLGQTRWVYTPRGYAAKLTAVGTGE